MNETDLNNIREKIIDAIRTVEDPEIPVNLYDLGLIYELEIEPTSEDPDRIDVKITMTLTTPNCPVAESMPLEVQRAVKKNPNVNRAVINLVWNPPWSSERMSDDARLQLDFMGISWKDPNVGPRNAPAPTQITLGRKNPDD